MVQGSPGAGPLRPLQGYADEVRGAALVVSVVGKSECLGHAVAGHLGRPHRARTLPPPANDGLHPGDSGFRFRSIDAEAGGDAACQIQVDDVVGLRDVECQARRIWYRVQVVGRGQFPTLARPQEEGVVAEVVVGIGDQHAEDDTTPEFRQAASRGGTVLGQHPRQFQVAHTGGRSVAILVPGQGHGGGDMDPLPLGRAVEA